ncbi:MAG: hypothetical protein JSR45_00500 [Proteobacteria bacterium]|nr:hypothetical protein [Pseudomonadota bacterium]
MNSAAPVSVARPFDRTFRYTLAERWMMLPTAPVLLAAAVADAGLGALVMQDVPWLAALMELTALGLVALLPRMIAETRARWRLKIRIWAGSLEVWLPAERGYAALPPVEQRTALSRVDAVETRVEAYRAVGIATLQRGWSLRLKDGSRIDLGADRYPLKPLFETVAREVAARSGAPIHDLGMVDASASGAATIYGAKAPAWSAAALDAATAARRRRSAGRIVLLFALGEAAMILVKVLHILFGH